MKHLALVLILWTFALQFAEAKECPSRPRINDTCYVSLEKIHPTQFSLGMVSMTSRIEKVQDVYQEGELKKYLKKNIAPAIIGPDGRFYITDKHHTSYSILNSDIPHSKKRLYLTILHDWKTLSKSEFESLMVKNNYVWLKDRNYRYRHFSKLPACLKALTDDPYRSLAWKVRKNKGFTKINFSFQEFYWGEFFKQQGIHLESSDEWEIEAVLEDAMKLAKSKAAQHLPGHKGL